MGKLSKKASENLIPVSYEELYVHYILGVDGKPSLCRKLIRSMYRTAPDEDVENLMHDVFLRCQEYDVISKFDPTKANFGAVIYWVTRSVVRNYQIKQGRDVLGTKRRVALQMTDTADGEFEPGTVRLDMLFSPGVENEDRQIVSLDAKIAAEKLFSYAKRISENPKSYRDKYLFRLMELVMKEYEINEIATDLKIGRSTVFDWLRHLREVSKGLVKGDSV